MPCEHARDRVEVIAGMVPGTAREQFQRVERALANVEELGRKMDAEINGDVRPYQDAVLAFFVACWSLRDWVLKDPRRSATREELDALIDAAADLKASADIANGIKHTFPATKHVRSRPYAAVGHTFRTRVEEGPPGPNRAFKQSRDWIINIGLQRGLAHGASMEENCEVSPESQVEARVLARACVAAWRSIFLVLDLETG